MKTQKKKQGIAADAKSSAAPLDVSEAIPFDRSGFAELDSYDVTILSVLMEHPRLALVEVAKVVHLSRSAVSRRLATLKEKGIILRQADIVSYARLGFGVSADIELSAASRSAQAIREELLEMPEVLSVSIVSGDKQIVLNVIALDMEHFRCFVVGLQRYGDTSTRLKFSTSTSTMTLRDRIQAIRRQNQN